MIYRRTLLIEKKNDYLKRFYKDKSFWELFNYEYQYHEDYGFYWEEKSYDSESKQEMKIISSLCDEENLIEEFNKVYFYKQRKL